MQFIDDKFIPGRHEKMVVAPIEIINGDCTIAFGTLHTFTIRIGSPLNALDIGTFNNIPVAVRYLGAKNICRPVSIIFRKKGVLVCCPCIEFTGNEYGAGEGQPYPESGAWHRLLKGDCTHTRFLGRCVHREEVEM